MRVPACFENYIGIRGECNPIQPTSGLYIDDLQGITVDMASKVADGALHGTGVEYLRRGIENGILLALDDFKQYASQLYTIRTVLNMTYPGTFNTTYLPNTLGDRGVRITKKKQHPCNGCHNGMGGRSVIDMQSMFITNVRILINNTHPGKTLHIEDGLYSTSFDTGPLVAGQEKIVPINYRAHNPTIFIYMNDFDVSVNAGSLNLYYNSCETCGYYKNTDPNISVSGWDGMVDTGQLFGILPEIKIDCNEELLYCALADKMKYVILYRAGMEIVKGWMASHRVNVMTTYNADIGKMLLEEWKETYDTKYKYFQNSIREFLNKFDGSCIHCRGMKVTYGF